MQFGNSFLLDIFQKIVPNWNQSDGLIVKLYFVSIGSFDYKPLDFIVVIRGKDIPTLFIQKLIIFVFSQIHLELDLKMPQRCW